MPAFREIRADYDRETIVVYQAYSPAIAGAALQAGRFVPPFSFRRMTWIKPSFLWLMDRSNWGMKSNQECILAVRINREGWDQALRLGVLTNYEPKVHPDRAAWAQQFEQAVVHVQWDPERSIQGAHLPHRAIQVGLSRHVIREYVADWVVELTDYTPLTKKIRRLCDDGHFDRAKRLLPSEKIYAVEAAIATSLGMNC
jgi:hypothetical protein